MTGTFYWDYQLLTAIIYYYDSRNNLLGSEYGGATCPGVNSSQGWSMPPHSNKHINESVNTYVACGGYTWYNDVSSHAGSYPTWSYAEYALRISWSNTMTDMYSNTYNATGIDDYRSTINR